MRDATVTLGSQEEATLGRIARGRSSPQEYSPGQVRRLKHLDLVDDSAGRLRLTAAGRRWYAAAQSSAPSPGAVARAQRTDTSNSDAG